MSVSYQLLTGEMTEFNLISASRSAEGQLNSVYGNQCYRHLLLRKDTEVNYTPENIKQSARYGISFRITTWPELMVENL